MNDKKESSGNATPAPQYIGTKIVGAVPHYSTDKEQEGYKVFYPDGYVSWSPKRVFEDAYRKTDGLSFGLAIEALKKGKKVARTGWNGKGMYLTLQSSYPVNGFLNADSVDGPIYAKPGHETISPHKGGQMLPCILMKTAGDSHCWGKGYSDYVPWLASQTDMLADDWQIV